MGFLGRCILVKIHNSLDLSFHGEVARVIYIIQFKTDARKFGAFPILGDGVMRLEEILQVADMAVTNVFKAKVVHDEEK